MVEVDENGVNKRMKYLLGAYLILIVIGDILSAYFDTVGMGTGSFEKELGSYTIWWFGLLFGWFWCAPSGAHLANDYNRNPNWGFALGCLFNLVGVAFYWFYCWVFGIKK